MSGGSSCLRRGVLIRVKIILALRMLCCMQLTDTVQIRREEYYLEITFDEVLKYVLL